MWLVRQTKGPKHHGNGTNGTNDFMTAAWRQEAASPRKQTNGDETSFLSKRLVCDSEEVERLEFPEVTAAVWKGWSFPGRFNRGLTVMSLPTLSISTTETFLPVVKGRMTAGKNGIIGYR